MKAFSKIATAIVAGCALVGVTTGGAILLSDDDKDIIVNVDTNPQEEPKDPEVPGGEVTPEQPQEDENPTGEETPEEKTIPGDNTPAEGDENPEDIPQDTPAEEKTPSEEETPEPQQDGNPTDGYITVEVRLYNRHSGVYSKSDILNFEGEGSISVYNLYEKIKAEYPSREKYSEPSESFNTYLKYSDDSTIDLIVHFK